MEPNWSARPLAEADVLVVDCQATAAAPRGHLLEIGWARAGQIATDPRSCVIAMPEGERVPPAVARITGITDRIMRAGVDASVAWRALARSAATLAPQPAPTIIHFARFEEPFLRRLAGGDPLLDIVCTHAIAARLLPDLPRRGLRALAGYFGCSVGVLRRSADHVQATAFVWRELVALLATEGVSTWSGLKGWLARPMASARPRRRVWPMPRDVRLALPDAPGVYRMLRTSGDVLYVGKAASLHNRVNSYFRQQHGVPERMLEMLSQARGVSIDLSPSALEAALLEADEIKRLGPPYNIALTERGRELWFASPDLGEYGPRPSPCRPAGPFPSVEPLDQFAALVQENRAALGRGRWAPDAATFGQGHARFSAAHVGLGLSDVRTTSRLLRLGARLWREGRRDRDADENDDGANGRRAAQWTPDAVQQSLEWLVIRVALARRRATWLTRLADATVVWQEPGADSGRLIVVENGEITDRARTRMDLEPPEPPVPPGHRRRAAERHEAFTIARFDRLRVLTTELKRLVTAGAPVAVRFDRRPPLAGARLASLLGWL